MIKKFLLTSFLALTVVFSFVPANAFAAIAYGGISAVSTSQTPTSVTVTGTNPIGIVYVNGETASDDITAVTWGGISMTKIAAVQTPGDRWKSMWWVANPVSGGTISFTGGTFWRSVSLYYTGAKQASQVDSSNTGSNSNSTSISVATTVVATDSWLVMGHADATGGVTYSASDALTSMRFNADAGGIAIADSNGTVAVGSQTGTLSGSPSTAEHGAIIFSIAPAPAGIDFVRTSTTVNPASDTVAFDATATNGYLVVQTLKQSSETVSGVTFNGVAMTQLVTRAGLLNETLYLWGLANPTTGTNNIVVTDSGAATLVVDAILYSGAQQTTAVEATGNNSGIAGTTATVSVTTATDNAWVVGYMRSGSASGSFTAGANTEVRTAGAEGTRQLMDTGADQSPTGSKTLTATMLVANWATMGFSLKPFVAAVATATSIPPAILEWVDS